MSIDWSAAFSVVVTGLIVVFIALVILIFAVMLCSKCVSFFDNRGLKEKSDDNKLGKKKENIKIEQTYENLPYIENDIDEETVAAITAAIVMMGEADGTEYKITGIKRKPQTEKSSSAWARVGRLQNVGIYR